MMGMNIFGEMFMFPKRWMSGACMIQGLETPDAVCPMFR